MSKKEIKKLEQKKLEKLNKKYPNAKIISDVKSCEDRINEKRKKLLALRNEVILTAYQQIEIKNITDEYEKAKNWLIKAGEEIFEKLLDNQIGLLEAVRDGKVITNIKH